MDLQKRIAMAHDMDINVDDTMNVLLGKRPNIWKDELKDWRLEKLDEGNVLFFKGRNYVPKDDELRRDILRMFLLLLPLRHQIRFGMVVNASGKNNFIL